MRLGCSLRLLTKLSQPSVAVKLRTTRNVHDFFFSQRISNKTKRRYDKFQPVTEKPALVSDSISVPLREISRSLSNTGSATNNYFCSEYKLSNNQGGQKHPLANRRLYPRVPTGEHLYWQQPVHRDMSQGSYDDYQIPRGRAESDPSRRDQYQRTHRAGLQICPSEHD